MLFMANGGDRVGKRALQCPCQSVIVVTFDFGPTQRADAQRHSAYKKKPELVTFYSRVYWEYRFRSRDGSRRRPRLSGFWRPATRSSWIPPVPETAGRQI